MPPGPEIGGLYDSFCSGGAIEMSWGRSIIHRGLLLPVSRERPPRDGQNIGDIPKLPSSFNWDCRIINGISYNNNSTNHKTSSFDFAFGERYL